tara:strand:- start:3293 stop:3655 length:363 start_codon:yes stop_codon:yes gene_type:complete
MGYAVGKYSQAQCDRCGFVYKYLQLRKEWNGLKVCSTCFEPKHPQLEPITTPTDPEALIQPRGTESAPTTGYGVVKTENTKNSLGVTAPSMFISHNDTIGSSFFTDSLVGEVGEVTVTTG